MNVQQKPDSSMSVIAASYLGPSLTPNEDSCWEEAILPRNCDELVQNVLGQPMRRAGRYIKMVCSGAAACLKKVPRGLMPSKRTGIFLATGLGNGDEILPFITQVFLHDGGFPRPNQFANSVSNAAAFFLAQQCGIKGLILTLSEEELSFESALWLAQSYLESNEIDLALVGGCDVYTPTIDEYRDRMNVRESNARALPIGEGSSWLLLGGPEMPGIGEIKLVDIGFQKVHPDEYLQSKDLSNRLRELVVDGMAAGAAKRFLLPGFRMKDPAAIITGENGWLLHDYLPFCGIHPTAAAFGLAHALQKLPSSLFVHFNCSDAGKPALVVASAK
jgi:hypothetical protein